MSSNFEFEPIPPEELNELVTILENRFPKAAQLCNIAQTSLQVDFPEVTTFFRYNGFPDHLTSFISKLETRTKTYWCLLAPICGDDEMREVMRSFCRMVDWTKEASFNAVDVSLFEHLSNGSWKPEGRCPTEHVRLVHTMRKEVALALHLDTPKEVSVRKLGLEDLDTVFRHWKYAGVNDLELVRGGAIHVGSAGLFVDGHLVSWGIDMRDGGIHAVETLEEYRGLGYGKILMRHLARAVAGQGVNHFPVVHVAPTNTPSIRLMTTIGFQFSHTTIWAEYVPCAQQD